LALSIRGVTGNPTHETMNHVSWKDDGPLELSPERGRFALTFSIIEDNSLTFSVPVARFATPDLGYIDGKYVSLFAPGISYLVIPGYVIGKEFGLAQVGTYAVISVFALINVILLRAVAVRLGASGIAGTIASFIFLFATPAYTYAVSLFQHHVSTFLILLSLYLLLRFNNLFVLVFVWFLLAASIPIDYPNLILMFPVGIYALSKFFSVKQKKEEYQFKFKLLGIGTFIGVVLPLMFFMRFNEASYGNPFQFSGTVSSVKAINEYGEPAAPEETGTAPIESLVRPENQKKSAVAFFQSRNMLNGLASQFINRDRGIIWFAPVILFSVFGIAVLYKRHAFITTILISIAGMTLTLYSMWGDPYGGWAFGSRYLIPAYAIMGIFLAFAIDRYRKNLIFIIFFILASLFSLSVNTLGAITSSRNPPKPEILALEALTGREEKYGFDRNFQMIQAGRSKSYLFQTYADTYMTAMDYYVMLAGLLGVVFIGLVTYATARKDTIHE
ncbi:hypothetical protein HY469_02905, partial [Candidatus Roizmanbacteria bacterium]|nr:hypothetical protein [Candidatus Roizmanbacteria bacterium]